MTDPTRPHPGYRISVPSVPERVSFQVPVDADPSSASAATQLGAGSEAIAPGETHKICPTCSTRHPAHFRACPRDATPLIEADEIVGTTLDGTYVVTRILGEGGMGRVYEARHARIPGKRLALKTLHPELAQQQAVLTRFQREAEAAASISSPHVVDVYDVSVTADGRPCIVSELLQGKELGDHLIEVGRMPVGPAVRIVRQICSGLAAAHARGVLHRDMKPENVFLAGDITRPAVKIIDFGISRIGERSGLTHTGMIMGTPSYMAPEQARGEHVDHRADLYAVGAILYRALTGQPPFDRDEASATLVAVLTEDPPRPRLLNAEIPVDLEAVIQRAMAKAPADRYPTADDLSRALAPFDIHDAGGADGALAAGGAGARATFASLSGRQAAEVGLARPALLLTVVLGLAGLAAGITTSLLGFARIARGGGAAMTGAGGALLALGVSFGVLGPTLVAAYYVRRSAWNDDARVLELARRIVWPVALGLGAYGFASLLVRLLEAVVLCDAIGIAWPAWDPLLFLMGLGVAVGCAVFQWREGRGPGQVRHG